MQVLDGELSGFKASFLCYLNTTASCCGAGEGPLAHSQIALFAAHSLTKCNKSFTPLGGELIIKFSWYVEKKYW